MIALTAVACVGLVPAAAAGRDPGPEGTPGGAGVGDRLFPTLGNAGYDALRYRVRTRYADRDPAQTVTSTVRMTAVATQDLSRFDLDFGGDAIGAVRVDGASAAVERVEEELEITPAEPVAEGVRFTVVVTGAEATPRTRTGEPGFVYTEDGSFLAAQPDVMHDVIPCNDHPSDKAAFRFVVSTPRGWRAVANGVRDGRPDRTRPGRTVWRYEQAEPMAPELMQLAVGDLAVIRRGRVGEVLVRDVVPRRLADELEPQLAAVSDQLTWMQERAGDYPFATYGNFIVDDPTFVGALETQTLSVYGYPIFGGELADGGPVPASVYHPVMLHELAHQWFGDDVAPQVWSDVWLNEGHATWYQELYAEDQGYLAEEQEILGPVPGATSVEEVMAGIYAQADQLRAETGPVARPDDPDAVFETNSYYGGALVLYALRQEIGPRAFGELERRWVEESSGTSRSTDDYVALASEVAGRDLESFLHSWLYSTRTPPMPGHPDWEVDPVTPS